MALVHNAKDSLFGGVNQQAAEYRQQTQVEEMVNAYPTIDKGLLKRNPTAQKILTSGIEYTDDIWTYEYSRGFAGDTDEKYAINITSAGGMEIVNVETGKVYKDGVGLTLEGEAHSYLFPFIGANGYAATTIKDTTFIVNKNRTPILDNRSSGSEVAPVAKTYHYNTQDLVELPARQWVQITSGYGDIAAIYNTTLSQSNHCPFIGGGNIIDSGGSIIINTVVGSSTLTVIIDGISIVITTPRIESPLASGSIPAVGPVESLTSYHARVESSIRSALDPALYSVERADSYGGPVTAFPPIRITKWDETAVAVSYTLVLDAAVTSPDFALSSIPADYLGTNANSTWITTATPPTSDYENDGFIWVKRSDPAGVGYTYTYSVIDALGTSHSGSVTNTTTDGAATAIAADITTHASFTATSNGSVVKITALDTTMDRVDASDSYGGQASIGWAGEVTTSNDLPKNLGFTGSLVKVIGTSDNAFAAYWLIYTAGQWRETVDPSSAITINPTSMPHILVRNADDTFTLKAYDQWADKTVGDAETNKPVSFLSTVEDPSPVIKDIFFFKNRLGFITSRTVVMSEVGNYGNFWRTTVAALIDSDRIDSTVDTTKAIDLEYATYLEDSVMLFADVQFRLQGGAILSPSNVQISQTSAYNINRNVRPVFMNDRVFFCVNRGNHTAVMEYFVSESASAKSEANDITAHCQTYIPTDVTKLSGSAINNMLFVVTKSQPDTVFVYKYYDSGGTRVQAAWFKWSFNGTLFNAFSFGDKLNLMIARTENIAVSDWVLATGIWEGLKLWTADGIWIGSPEELGVSNQFEQMDIAPNDYVETEFIDDNRIEEDTSLVVGYSINSTVASGEVLSREDFLILLLAETTFYFEQALTAGTVTYTVHLSNGSTYSAVATPTDVSYGDVTIIVPATLGHSVSKITVEPEYTVLTTGEVYFPEIFQVDVEGNMLPKLNNYGWYVDSVAVPTDPLVLSQGDWFKVFGTSQVGSVIHTMVSLGEWVLDRGGVKETRGELHFKTAQITSETGSDFSLVVEDVKRDTIRTVLSKYTVGRKPMVYGNSKNIRVHIANNTSSGFRINTVSFEGNFNIRSKRT